MSELQRSLSEPVFLYSRTKAVSLSVFIGRGGGVQIASTGPCTRGISSVHLARILVILLVFILLFFVHMVASFLFMSRKRLAGCTFQLAQTKIDVCEERPVVEMAQILGQESQIRILPDKANFCQQWNPKSYGVASQMLRSNHACNATFC